MHAEPLAPGCVVDLDLRRLHRHEVARLPGPRELLDLLTREPPGPDLLECPVLLLVAALVEVEHPRVRRALLVVAVARRERDREAGEVSPVHVALEDLPRKRALADA